MSKEKLDNLQNEEGKEITPNEEVKSFNENVENSNEKEAENEGSTAEAHVEDVEAKTEENKETEKESEEAEVKEIPVLDYASMSADELYDEAYKLVKHEAVDQIKNHVDFIREAFFKLINEDKNAKKQEFVEAGGNSIDFKYDSYIKNQFSQVYKEYRKKREVYLKSLEKEQNKNYEIRLELIEELKHLIGKEEKMSETYKEFKDIQEKWKAAGNVPKSKSSDLWRNYHHHVENFYDYLRLNNEMRDLDFKHNLEEKLKLVERAEELINEESIKIAFDELQLLHKMWKEETGPVAKEFREEIWHRFSNATKAIHDRRHEQQKHLKVQWTENLEKKEEICNKILEVAQEEGDSHSLWQKRIKKVDALKNEFQKTGRVPKSSNEEIWEKFKESTRQFNKRKNNFYKGLKKDQHLNLEKKMKLVEVAESLKDSEDWKKTTEVLKKIQADWKKIGHVPKQQSDEIWDRFRNACNHFFDRLTAHRNDVDSEFNENYKNKKEFLSTIESLELPKDSQEAVKALTDKIAEWKNFGPVPRDKKSIENEFNKKIDAYFDKLNLDKDEANFIKFKNRVDSFMASEEMKKVYHERDIVRKKMDEIRKEISQLENNLGFFNVDENNPLVKEVKKNLGKHKEHLKLWKRKLDYLRTL